LISLKPCLDQQVYSRRQQLGRGGVRVRVRQVYGRKQQLVRVEVRVRVGVRG